MTGQPYTVYLFRSGRVWVQEGTHVALTQDTDPPLIVENVVAQTEYGAIGLVLLKYVDAANQPHQHVCPPCEAWCCMPGFCPCGKPISEHNSHPLQACHDVPHMQERCTAVAPCYACQQRTYGL
jgi:hypothetical protein